METTNLATLILFSEDNSLTGYDDRSFVDLVFVPYDEEGVGCNCWDMYEMIG